MILNGWFFVEPLIARPERRYFDWKRRGDAALEGAGQLPADLRRPDVAKWNQIVST